MEDFLKNALLTSSLDTFKSYIHLVLPLLTKKNKRIASVLAISLMLVYFIKEKILKPPKHLRHIPYFGYYGLIKSFLQGECLFERGYNTHIPYINQHDGLYMEPGKSGWEIHLSNPKDIRYVLMKHETFPKANFKEGGEHTLIVKFTGGPNIGTSIGDQWKKQRQVINPAFRHAMPIGLFGRLTLQLFDVIEITNGTVEVSDLMMRFALEAIGKSGFDFDFNAIRDGKNKWTSTFHEIQAALLSYTHFVFPSLDQRFLWALPYRRASHQKLDEFMDMLDTIIQERRAALLKTSRKDHPQEEKDILTLMLENEEILSNDELKSNLCLFFLAGHDTSASALIYTLYYLAKYPEIQQRARLEAIEIWGDTSTDMLPTALDLQKLNYINCIIKETLRLNDPAARIFIPRVASKDTTLSGTFVPKGSHLMINLFNAHHCDKFWKDPTRFNPDRFLETTSKSWIPFSSGARQCIGKDFSLNEQRVMISMFLRKYIWTLPTNSIHKDKLITGNPITSVKGGLKLDFVKR